MSPEQPLENLRLVLVGTSHPGNIGSAARAMKAMGLRQMALVAPECDPGHRDAMALAAGADDLIAKAERADDLNPVLADCTLVFGTTARQRGVRMPGLSPREAASRLLAAARAGQRVAVLFGRESSGLNNDELQRCHAAIHIATDPAFSSLNLAAAVQVVAYELRMAELDGAPPATAPDASDPEEGGPEPPATHAELEGLFGHLDRALHAIDFHKGRSPDTVMRRLRRLFFRAAPSEREIRILHGILADAERMARLADAAGGQDRG
ncbi:RNA methyltransferase [Pseudomarimonas salicorniae]|uniref:tRNA (cytidine/uridine-2'-O-)-methyltransferase TrmJ n=1 Tax=Pseudomarimonas salicorniae TaxID=2933270 RepID=A0ABT0GE30_9GAMM|nr:RNA methyltransferase [Lysobacter sp. CAU 1642]MCK7592607.1 RNA methyltransferase [Lysobacter sp. CAU 1642]